MPTLRCKVVLLGDAAVGKSALTQMFHSDSAHYPKNYVMTVGVEFCVKAVHIPDTNYTVELYLFDCAGHDMYQALVSKYFEGTAMVAIIYDVTQPSSFESCSSWLSMLRTELDKDGSGQRGGGKAQASNMPGVLIANKMDLEGRITVKSHKGHEFAQANNLEFFEISALSGKDVDAPFNFIASQFHELYVEKLQQVSKN